MFAPTNDAFAALPAGALSGLLADGPVVLFFYPAAMTTGCTKESCHFRDLGAEFVALRPDEGVKVRPLAERLAAALPAFGFLVHPSEANFLWTTHATGQHKEIYEQLKARKILVRYMRFPDALPDGGTLDGLRITIGTDAEIDRVLEVMGGVTSSL